MYKQGSMPLPPVETRRRELKPMLSEDFHPGDQELLMAADGELSVRRATGVRAHLARCWDCRARMAEIEGTIADFARIHREISDPKLPPIAGSRAQLRARLAELATKPHPESGRWLFRFGTATRVAAYVCGAIFVTVVTSKLLVQHPTMSRPNSAAISFEPEAVPNRSLTPGAVRQVAVSDVCAMAHEEVVTAVPASLRQLVFQEYGIANTRADNYEIDYLITSGLGGVGDIHNLWPEPNASPVWNSHVKDALEERLHELVCSGKLDLPTAQHEIATDWIAAYRKYFSTDEPLSLGSNRIRFFGAFIASSEAPEK
jgi:anti-sigma factor RsiW